MKSAFINPVMFEKKLICFAAIGILLLSWNCGESNLEKSDPDKTKHPANTVQTTKPTVYFGVISRYNPRVMFEEYQPIMDYLTKNTPFNFELKLGKTYEDAVDYLCSGEVQIASLGGLTYLEAHKRCGAVPIVRPLNKNGHDFYRSIIIVRKDSPIQTLNDLRGHSYAFASIHSTSGNLIARYTLANAGLKLSDFSFYKNFKHHDQVAKEVLRGHIDAGSVKDIIAYRNLKKGLRILNKSEPIPSVPLVAKSDCNPEIVNSLKEALLKIDPSDPQQKKMLATWNEEFRYGFIKAKDSDYLPLRKILNNIPQTCGSTCHPRINL